MVQIQRKSTDADLHIKHIYLHDAAQLRPDLAKGSAIAIDGPAGAGKSTIAKKVSTALGHIYIDTGAMYRAVAYYCKKKDVNCSNEQDVIGALDDIDIKITIQNDTQHIYLNDEDITDLIRNQETASAASTVASYDKVRKQLVALQRKLAAETSVVMDGRDIGTHVLPNAKLKIFLTASIIERATRRAKELEQKGYTVDLNEIKQEIMDRDYNDSNREFSPLCKASDAVEVDTTGKSIDEVTQEILQLINGRL
ncbi:MAG TPA: (d)CMP kinase [Epulopiscium sp.]|nr:(d)CMP kinase [Candidatus Epulonipiscium sp.]